MPSRSSLAEGSWILIHSASGAARVALSRDGKLQEFRQGVLPRGGARELPSLVQDWVSGQVSGLAVFLGPGSFTGIRIGIAFARGLTRARGLPLVGIDGLEALAATSTESGDFLVGADALRGECLGRIYRQEAGLPTLQEDLGRISWADLPPGLPLLVESLPRGVDRAGTRVVSGEPLLVAATRLLAAGLEKPVQPLWTRPSWAEESGDAGPRDVVKLEASGRE